MTDQQHPLAGRTLIVSSEARSSSPSWSPLRNPKNCAYVRTQLRGSRTPDRVVFRDERPTNATGKILRRDLVDELNATKEPA